MSLEGIDFTWTSGFLDLLNECIKATWEDMQLQKWLVIKHGDSVTACLCVRSCQMLVAQEFFFLF